MATLKKKPAPAAKPAEKPAAKVAASTKEKPPVKASSTRPPPGKGRVPGSRAPRPTWEAPEDMKPAFFQVKFMTDDFGYIKASTFSGERIRGRWDNDKSKRYNLAEYDNATLLALGMVFNLTAANNKLERRLPPNRPFMVVIRAARRSTDGIITARITALATKSDKTKKVVFITDKTDENWKKIRRVSKALPGAFVVAQLPPTRRPAKDDPEE